MIQNRMRHMLHIFSAETVAIELKMAKITKFFGYTYVEEKFQFSMHPNVHPKRISHLIV